MQGCRLDTFLQFNFNSQFNLILISALLTGPEFVVQAKSRPNQNPFTFGPAQRLTELGTSQKTLQNAGFQHERTRETETNTKYEPHTRTALQNTTKTLFNGEIILGKIYNSTSLKTSVNQQLYHHIVGKSLSGEAIHLLHNNACMLK